MNCSAHYSIQWTNQIDPWAPASLSSSTNQIDPWAPAAKNIYISSKTSKFRLIFWIIPLNCCELLSTLFDSMNKSNRSLSSSSRKIQCPDFQENQGKKRGPARQTERKIDKFKEGKSILDIFRVSNIYLGKFREGK